MKKIEKIEAKKPAILERKKVCAYARVSMETDRLKHSLSAQISYYSKLIQNNPEWEFKGVYSDYGITGTSTVKRAGFREMLEECEKGNIDLILTKSIKRFARNTVDLLKVVRHLKSKGIEVRFENENINSLSGDGELMLSILASFAQEESRSISENVKWGTRKRFEQGIPNGKFSIYGYRWEGDKLVVKEDEAKNVRFIFDNYLKGISAEKTEKELEEMGVKSYNGLHFSNSSIRHILSNITYTGNLLFQKEYVVDPILGKSKLNHGELPQYFVENSHEAIIPMEIFKQVEAERLRRRKVGALANPAIATTEMTSKIKCVYCGRSFHKCRRRTVNRGSVFWQCATRKAAQGNPCHTGDLNDIALKELICKVLGIDEYDPDAFAQRVNHIDVIRKEKLIFHFADGNVVETQYPKLNRKEYFTDEIRANLSKQRRDKHRYHRKNSVTPFTGIIECAKCANSFNALTRVLKTGEKIAYLSCRTNRSECPHNSIQDVTLKALVCEVLKLDEFDEQVMDEQIKRIYIADSKATFKLKDGREIVKEYSERKRGTPWSKERREKQLPKMHEYWANEDNRKAASERFKKIWREKNGK